MKNIAAFSKRFLEENRGKESLWPARILLCLAVLISYASVWSNEFVFNDGILIGSNAFLKQWGSLPRLLTSLNNAGYGRADGFYRPLQMLIYFLIYQAAGASTIAFHALNVSLQALNTCLMHHFGIRAGFKKGAAFAAALLWTVHPLHTNDVAYMSSTAELLWSCFCLLGLITLLPDFTPGKIGKALAFFILALGSKEPAVVFPALAALTLFFVSKGRAPIAVYLRTWPLWLLSAGYIAVWLIFIHTSGSNMDAAEDPAYASLFSRILTCLATLPVYARLILWPSDLHIEWFFPVYSTLAWQSVTGALMAGLGLLLIARTTWLRRGKHAGGAGVRQGLALSFGLLWFAVTLSPYTGIVIPVDALVNEGWMYVPMMGLFLGAAEAAAGFFEKKKNAARLIVLSVTVLLSTATFLQNQTWHTSETLYLNNVKNWDRSDRLYLLGLFYMEKKEFDKAIGQFQDQIDHPDGHSNVQLASTHMWLAMALLHVNVKNDNIITNDLMLALRHSSHIPEAIGELGKALRDNPDFYQVHTILAVIYRYQGNNQMADFHDKKAQEISQKQEKPAR